MGHMSLQLRVSHIWYFKGIPSRMGLILDISPRTSGEEYCISHYIVLDPKANTVNLAVQAGLLRVSTRKHEKSRRMTSV